METYPKIQTLFKRDMAGTITGQKGKMIRGEWTTPELEYLAGNKWEFTEKVDGTNIRIGWDARTGTVECAGRTDRAVIPNGLLESLYTVFTPERFLSAGLVGTYTLFGEGYGPKIQGGGKYTDINNFVLFDVTCDTMSLCLEHRELLNAIQTESTSLKDSVSPVTTKTLRSEIQSGPRGFGSKQKNTETGQNKRNTTPPRTERDTYAPSSDSRKKSMTKCWQTSMEFARYAERLKVDVAEAEGHCLSLSTIAMRQEEYADCYAKPATSASTRPSETPDGSTGLDCTCSKIGNWWLSRENVNDIASKLGIDSVPVIGYGTLKDAIYLVSGWSYHDLDTGEFMEVPPMRSAWGDFEAEGLVCRPVVPLFDRQGNRIICKVKAVDFK